MAASVQLDANDLVDVLILLQAPPGLVDGRPVVALGLRILGHAGKILVDEPEFSVPFRRHEAVGPVSVEQAAVTKSHEGHDQGKGWTHHALCFLSTTSIVLSAEVLDTDWGAICFYNLLLDTDLLQDHDDADDIDRPPPRSSHAKDAVPDQIR